LRKEHPAICPLAKGDICSSTSASMLIKKQEGPSYVHYEGPATGEAEAVGAGGAPAAGSCAGSDAEGTPCFCRLSSRAACN